MIHVQALSNNDVAIGRYNLDMNYLEAAMRTNML